MKSHTFSLNTVNKNLLLPALFLITSSIGILGAVLVDQEERSVNALMQSKADNAINILQIISVRPVLESDHLTLENFVRESMKNKDIEFMEFYDASGRSLTGKVMKAPADISSLLVRERLIQRADGKIIGKVKVGYRTDERDRLTRNSVIIGAASIAGLMGVLAVGLTLVIRSAAFPLKRAITSPRETPTMI